MNSVYCTTYVPFHYNFHFTFELMSDGKDNTAQVTDTCTSTRHITYVRIAYMCSTRLGAKRVISHYRNIPESIFDS